MSVNETSRSIPGLSGKTSVQIISEQIEQIRNTPISEKKPPGYVFGKHAALTTVERFTSIILSENAKPELISAFDAGKNGNFQTAEEWFEKTYKNHETKRKISEEH